MYKSQWYALWCICLRSILVANEVVGWTPSIMFPSWYKQTESLSPRWWLKMHSVIGMLLEVVTIACVLIWSKNRQRLPLFAQNAWYFLNDCFTVLILINFWHFLGLPVWLAVLINFTLLGAQSYYMCEYQTTKSRTDLFGYLVVFSFDIYFRLVRFFMKL